MADPASKIQTNSKQNGDYDPYVLNLEAVDEPFPVKATIRSRTYRDLIIREAENAGVLEDAKLLRVEL